MAFDENLAGPAMRFCRPTFLFGCVLFSACQAGGASLTDAERAAIAASADSATRAFESAERALDAERVIAHLAPEFYMYNDGVRSEYDSVAASIRRTLGTFQHFEPGFTAVEVIVLGRDGAVVSFTFRDSRSCGSAGARTG
jgi:hypothetical protein